MIFLVSFLITFKTKKYKIVYNNYLLRHMVFMIFWNVKLIHLQNRFDDFETMLIKLTNELFLGYFSIISSYSVGIRRIWCQLNIIHFFITNLMFFRLFFININQFSLYWTALSNSSIFAWSASVNIWPPDDSSL